MAVRERTDSITHLVKIIAKEVFDANYNHLRQRITELENRVVLYQVDNDLQKAGEHWSHTEDQLLVDSLNRAIDIIASAHGRTPVAIRSRIEQKELL